MTSDLHVSEQPELVLHATFKLGDRAYEMKLRVQPGDTNAWQRIIAWASSALTSTRSIAEAAENERAQKP